MFEIILSIFWLGVIPFMIGSHFAIKLKHKNIIFALMSGYIAMFALFQALHLISLLLYNNLTVLTWVFGCITVVVALINICLYENQILDILKIKIKKNINIYILLSIVFLLIVYQLYVTARYQFVDGDDSVYVAYATDAWEYNMPYLHEANSGDTSPKLYRHAFSAMPIFVAFLAKVTMAHPTTVHHILFPMAIILLMYAVYYCIAKMLTKKTENALVFLILINAIYIFGNASIYSATTFLLTRTAQGKSIIGNLIMPIMIAILIMYAKDVKNKSDDKFYYKLLALVVVAAGSCSILGLVLAATLIVVSSCIFAIVYKKWNIIYYLIASMVPAVLLGALYVCFYR